MKKILVLSVGVLLLMSSCGTYTESGAVTGGWFGSIIGSAIGGIAGGHRGSDIGTLVGMAGGAVVGAAIGQAADNAQQQRIEEYRQQRQERYDDRLYGFDENFNNSPSQVVPATDSNLEIRNPHLIDSSRDGVLTRGEEARVVFEIFNTSSKPVYRVLPMVRELTGNKHIRVSENVLVESIMPGKGIRYTAVVRADNKLHDGEAVFRISVFQGSREMASQAREFRIMTSKR
jgi:hypothetical protein